jgi:hypothetical protein
MLKPVGDTDMLPGTVLSVLDTPGGQPTSMPGADGSPPARCRE